MELRSKAAYEMTCQNATFAAEFIMYGDKTQSGGDINRAAEALRSGGLVALPTETVYGLAANALNPEAVLKIFELKKRPAFDPLIVHVPSLDAARSFVKAFPEGAERLAERFWPGPLTLVLPKRQLIPDLVTSGLDTLAIRIPNHPLSLSLLRELDFPLAAPSANPFGYLSPTEAAHVASRFPEGIDYILDGGPCEVGLESTIVSFATGEACILRPGGLEAEAIRDCVGEVKIAEQSSSKPDAPGMLSSHYAPRTPMLLGDLDELIKEHPHRKVAALHFCRKGEIPGEVLSARGDLREAAKNLFAALRRLDESDAELIIAEYAPNEGLGLAINDRLKRAAYRGESEAGK